MIVTEAQAAIDVLARGSLCAIPTETVYGLAADASNLDAVAHVFRSKGRPSDHPLIVHVASLEDAMRWIESLPEWALALASECWPGPLTLVGARTKLASDVITGGQNTVAVRIPDHPLTLDVLRGLSAQGIFGVVAPSANVFGHVSPTTAQHVQVDLGEYLEAHNGLILDGGPCRVGVESTIVLATGSHPVVLRPGGITRKDITEVTGLDISNDQSAPRVSGSLDSHYSPDAEVTLITESDLDRVTDGGLIAFNDVATPAGVTRLASPVSIEEFANCLYAALRKADDLQLSSIYVVTPYDDGLAEAVRDRLRRAAF